MKKITAVNEIDEVREFKIGLLVLLMFACISLPAVFVYGAVGFVYTAACILGLIVSASVICLIGSLVIAISKGE